MECKSNRDVKLFLNFNKTAIGFIIETDFHRQKKIYDIVKRFNAVYWMTINENFIHTTDNIYICPNDDCRIKYAESYFEKYLFVVCAECDTVLDRKADIYQKVILPNVINFTCDLSNHSH